MRPPSHGGASLMCHSLVDDVGELGKDAPLGVVVALSYETQLQQDKHFSHQTQLQLKWWFPSPLFSLVKKSFALSFGMVIGSKECPRVVL